MTNASRYGDLVADVYDAWHDDLAFLDPAPTVELLSDLAGSGRILEVGVGTGRIAIPLAEQGLEVHGVDVSPRMIERLRVKDTTGAVRAHTEDFVAADLGMTFELVYLVFNTFFAFASQEEQLRLLGNIRTHLNDGGLLVLETYVPNVRRDQPVRFSVMTQGTDGVVLETSRHNLITQEIDTTWAVIGANGVRLIPLRTRYAWPAELDIMARLSGFELIERYGGWKRQPFTSQSSDYISVFRAVTT